MAEDNYEIVDTENYIGQKNIVFSHQDLVMRAMKRVGEIGGHELTEGINLGTSGKQKEEKLIIKEDTRKAFINAVRICKCIMNRDFDDEAKTKIKKCFDEMEEKRKLLLSFQWNWWNSLSPKQKSDKGIIVEKNFFNKTLTYYVDYIEMQIEKYWEIFEELNNLTARLGDYQIEDFEA